MTLSLLGLLDFSKKDGKRRYKSLMLEGLENLRQCLPRDPNTAVMDAELDAAAIETCTDGDIPPFGELDRIADQIP